MNFNKLNKIISEDKTWKLEEEMAPSLPMNGQTNSQINNPAQDIRGNLNIQMLTKYLPSQDPVKLKIAISNVMKGSRLNNIQLMSLGNAFIDLLKANTQETMKVMNLLKRVSMENDGGQN